jgi:rare lipoprotein A (peptidoglycan hydrolase)
LLAIVATVVLVPMLFSPAAPPSPPIEVSVAAVSPDYGVIPDDVGADADAGWRDGWDIAVAVAPEPSTTTSEPLPPTTETTVDPTTTTALPTTTTAPPTTTTTEVDPAGVAVRVHIHPEITPPTTRPAPPPPPPAPTTTTAPPPPPPPADAVRTQEGQASWYDLPGARAGVCAHRTIPKGTVVKVTNLDTGKSINCTVDDRGPYAEGKIIDLYRDDFARLAPLEQGVFPTRITW